MYVYLLCFTRTQDAWAVALVTWNLGSLSMHFLWSNNHTEFCIWFLIICMHVFWWLRRSHFYWCKPWKCEDCCCLLYMVEAWPLTNFCLPFVSAGWCHSEGHNHLHLWLRPAHVCRVYAWYEEWWCLWAWVHGGCGIGRTWGSEP